MKLQQLKCLCEVVSCGLSVTRAAAQLHQSQPGVSRHICLLEQELGVIVFTRKKKKFVGLTPIGQAIYAVSMRILAETRNIQQLASESKSGLVGDLTIATAPTHTRYTLPTLIERFISLYPRVRLCLREGSASQSAAWLSNGEADISISSLPTEAFPNIVFLPCHHKLHRIILTKHHHPLLKKKSIALSDVARYPIITYDAQSWARSNIIQTFHSKGLTPNIVLSSLDVDTIKKYVLSGLGIAIVAHTVYDRKTDRGIEAIEAGHLFEASEVHIGLRRYTVAPQYMLRFIELLSPNLSSEKVQKAIHGSPAAPEKLQSP